MTKKNNINRCECGCGAEVKNRFKQGHDAKLKSQLLRTIRDESVHHNTRAAANRKLARLGWA